MGWNDTEREDTTVYRVVINSEEQYSIWPEHKENPPGWQSVGEPGSKVDCMSYIKEVWTDMRPLSLRKKMEEMAKNPQPPPAPARPRERSLVERLCDGDHPVEVGVGPTRAPSLFQKAIDRKYVHIKFLDTKGGTELGVTLEEDACDFSGADFDRGVGTVHIEGGLTLDYVKVKCIADIDLKALGGIGHLVKVEATRDQAH